MRHLLLVLLIGVSASAGLAAATDNRDRIILKANDQVRLCYVDTETDDGKVKFRNAANAPVTEMRMSEVRTIEYSEMKEGAWAMGIERRDAGKYAEAADLFNAVATSGAPREWQKVYGSFQEGACLELAGNLEGAAAAFGRVATGFPANRLAMEATFRQGFALARAGKGPEALKIADQLTEMAKKNPSATGADKRGSAIRAVVAAVGGKGPDEVKKLANLARFSDRDEPDTYLQFGLFIADFLRTQNATKDAEMEYRRMLNAEGIEPAKKVQLSLGLGMCLVKSDPPSALVELLKLDALPYGSADQRCEARYWAGKLMLDETKAARAAGDDKDEKKAQFLKDQERAARFLLTAAAESTSNHPSRALAKTALEALGADPDAAPEAKPAGTKP